MRPGGGGISSCPAAEIRTAWRDVAEADAPFERLAQRFKVSPVAVGRRAMYLGLVERDAFFSFYHEYTQRERRQGLTGTGDFYNNQNTRVGRLLASHVIQAAKEGRIGFKEAYDLTGLNGGTFQSYARKLGIALP